MTRRLKNGWRMRVPTTSWEEPIQVFMEHHCQKIVKGPPTGQILLLASRIWVSCPVCSRDSFNGESHTSKASASWDLALGHSTTKSILEEQDRHTLVQKIWWVPKILDCPFRGFKASNFTPLNLSHPIIHPTNSRKRYVNTHVFRLFLDHFLLTKTNFSCQFFLSFCKIPWDFWKNPLFFWEIPWVFFSF